MLTMIGGVSEFFSDRLAVNVSKRQRERAEGGLPIGPVPFGYITESPGSVPLADPDEGRAVQIAFERRALGASYGEIARWLNSQGFETRGHNELFTPYAVKDMLKNTFYVGMIKYRADLIRAQHEPIVTEDLFQQVQARRGRAPTARFADGPTGLLQGRLHCGHCGSSTLNVTAARKRATANGTVCHAERTAAACSQCESTSSSLRSGARWSSRPIGVIASRPSLHGRTTGPT